MADKIKGAKFPTTSGNITVNADGIFDQAGEKVSEQWLVDMAQRNATQAKGNAKTAKGSEFGAVAANLANKGLQQNAESARDALFEYYSLKARSEK